MKVHSVRFDHLRDPLGIGTGTPRLSWQVIDAPSGWRQTGYDVEVRDLDTVAARPAVHHVESAEQILVPWPAAPLASRARAEVRVRVCGNAGAAADGPAVTGRWSDSAVVEAGLLHPSDWSARLIRPEPDAPGPTPRASDAAAHRGPAPGRTDAGTLVHHRRGSLPRRNQRPAGRRRRTGPRAGPATTTGCVTRPTTSPPCSPPAAMPSAPGCRRLVPRLRRLRRRSAQPLRPADRAAGPARGALPGRVHRGVRHRRRLAQRHLPDRLHRPVRGRVLRRTPRSATAGRQPGHDVSGWGTVEHVGHRSGPAGRSHGPAGALHRGARRARGDHHAERRDDPRLRPEHRRTAAHPRHGQQR